MKALLFSLASLTALLLATSVSAAESALPLQDFTTSAYGVLALMIFVLGYILVLSEEFIHLRKSKPIMVSAGLIWILVGIAYATTGDTETAGLAARQNILEYAELFLFLLAAMTFITTMEERLVFASLRAWLVAQGYSLRQIYWITGLLAFFISPVADNLSTALLMGAVVLAVGNSYRCFITVSCINIVIAANAGGAFSPFGDITTLMVWQRGLVEIEQFLLLMPPALVTWLVPAILMSFTIEREPPTGDGELQPMKKGGITIIFLFLATIALSISIHSTLHLPPLLGMMTGLGVLKLYGYYLSHYEPIEGEHGHISHHHAETMQTHQQTQGDNIEVVRRFNIFKVVERSSWDTLMFFYGVVLCVGGLASLGYLALMAEWLYVDLGAVPANILIGMMSALIDNIPVMYAVITMNPEMAVSDWLLATLTIGIGGSLLSIGSAAGIALMGQAQGTYTFASHLRWSWAIALGYAAGVATHLLIEHFV
ncbi:sodium:proton antiporter NhaD [Neptuniibacter sp. CAU 1671]|uniref:sodium:proton antiporter NhaD n=1 Tax=Neptuniibacter sp. CAU 1671 TaxID=3032593 RepID=UPI0023DCA9E1|nr:sodium:proton antiporter NhaD [Neptuniibacter sp. CAU 1671]MDF2181893.1 sodium:proton antiporter NhaD [Neptuniibacter sp. CAU 1671]